MQSDNRPLLTTSVALGRPASAILGIALLVGCSSSAAEGSSHPDAAVGDASLADAAPGDARVSDAGPPLDYSKAGNWVCGPNASHDYCLDPQTATRIDADASTTGVTLPVATSPKIDCFYVYPTVNVTAPAGNVTDFSNLSSILDPVMGQAAPFTQQCKVYAPFYRQATINSYLGGNPDPYLEKAYVDVAAAFSYYVSTLSNGRKFVLVGHSQGAHMIRRLIQRIVETDSALLARLVVALPIGHVGDIVVPTGALVGGSFQKVPLCTSPMQMGCVITYDSFAIGYEPDAGALFKSDAGAMQAACANPGSLDGGMARFGGSLFPTKVRQAVLDPMSQFPVTTDLAIYPDLYTGQCIEGPPGRFTLHVGFAPLAGDVRTNPVNFGAPLLSPGPPYRLGLHLLDFTFPMRELLDAVGTRASAL
jgi:hypothetical protein